GSRAAVTAAAAEGMLDRALEPAAVEVACQLVEVGEILEPLFRELARGDRTQGARHRLRLAVGADRHLTTLVHPAESPVRAPKPILAVEAPTAREMPRQSLEASCQIIRVDQIVEAIAGRDRAQIRLCQYLFHRAGPFDPIACEIPVIGDVAGSAKRRQHAR